MQQKPENDLIYLLASLEAAEKIMLYSGNFENATLFFESENQLHFNASLLLLATIGENVSKFIQHLLTFYWSKFLPPRTGVTFRIA